MAPEHYEKALESHKQAPHWATGLALLGFASGKRSLKVFE